VLGCHTGAPGSTQVLPLLLLMVQLLLLLLVVVCAQHGHLCATCWRRLMGMCPAAEQGGVLLLLLLLLEIVAVV
jgi:hypothetical protein